MWHAIVLFGLVCLYRLAYTHTFGVLECGLRRFCLFYKLDLVSDVSSSNFDRSSPLAFFQRGQVMLVFLVYSWMILMYKYPLLQDVSSSGEFANWTG